MDQQKKNPARPEPPAAPGRVHHDKQGRAIWQWAVDTGKHALESTSVLLKRLEVPGLKIEEDKSPFSQSGNDNDQGGNPVVPPPGGGYNPYGSAASGRSATPSEPPVKRPASAPLPPAVPRKDQPSFLKRLFGKR